jgi:hypothetical protein
MQTLPANGELAFSQINLLLGAASNATLAISSVRQDIDGLPSEGNIIMSTMRGKGRKNRGGFKILMNNKTWKLESGTNNIKLDSGTEMIFEIVSDGTVFNYNENADRRRFALKDTVSNLFVSWNSTQYTCKSFVANNADFAFRFITFDNGASYRIFNDKFTGHPFFWPTFTSPGSTDSTPNYTLMFPYVNTWVAYNPGSDIIVPRHWVDTSLSTTCTFDNVSNVNTAAINTVNPVTHFPVQYPSRPLSSASTNLSNTFTVSGTLYSTGTVTVSTSIQTSTRQSHKVFNGSTASLEDCWQPGGNNVGFDQWVQVQFPTSMKLHSYFIDLGGAGTTMAIRSPSAWEIHGIAQGSSTPVWIHSGSRPRYYNNDSSQPTHGIFYFQVNSSILYQTFRFVIKGFNPGQSLVSVPEIRFFGTQV